MQHVAQRSGVGISVGMVFDTVPDTLDNILQFLLRCGANAVELNLNLVWLRHFALFGNQELAVHLLRFRHVSLHLSEIGWKKDDMVTEAVFRHVDLIQTNIARAHVFDRPIEMPLVVHPDIIEDWDNLANINRYLRGMITVEFPMDKDKNTGKTLKELTDIRDKYDFQFVLDVQHVYELDPTGELAIEAAKIMGNRLSHLHVSGQKQTAEGLSRHSFLHQADNRGTIQRVLGHPALSGVPRISEGDFKALDAVAVTAELNCLRLRETGE